MGMIAEEKKWEKMTTCINGDHGHAYETKNVDQKTIIHYHISITLIILINHQQRVHRSWRHPTLDLGSNKRSSTRRINLVVPVLRSNYDTVVADVVAVVADDEDFARGNGSERLVAVRVAKGNN
jgi:hypothetical protein